VNIEQVAKKLVSVLPEEGGCKEGMFHDVLEALRTLAEETREQCKVAFERGRYHKVKEGIHFNHGCISKLEHEIEVSELAERAREYKFEWESACLRERGRIEDVKWLEEEIPALKKELELQEKAWNTLADENKSIRHSLSVARTALSLLSDTAMKNDDTFYRDVADSALSQIEKE
jgi:hypothetical protein